MAKVKLTKEQRFELAKLYREQGMNVMAKRIEEAEEIEMEVIPEKAPDDPTIVDMNIDEGGSAHKLFTDIMKKGSH